MKKANVILGTIILLLLTLSACQNTSLHQNDDAQTNVSSNDNTDGEGEEKMELTQRQKDILKKEGLSTNYEKLNDSQRKSIVAIEEMFLYLDDKYEMSFEYVGYRAASNIDKETLIVQPNGGTSADIVSVIRENGQCSDNYATVYYREAYENMIKEYIEAKVSRVEVFSDIEEVDNVADQKDLRPNVNATSGIYISESYMQNSNLADIADEFGQWYVSETNGKSCSFSFYVVSDETFWSITRFNRTNYNDDVISRINVLIKSDGSLVIR